MRHRALILAAGVSAVLLCTAACGGSSKPAGTTADDPSTSAPASLTSSGSAASSLTAAQIVAKLQAAKLPIDSVTIFTAATDPDHLLGKPNGYLSKAGFVDKNVPASEASSQGGGVAAGGEVEVFSTTAEAQARKQTISLAEGSGQMSEEYDVVDGTALLRLSQDLTATQVDAFAAAALG